MSTTIAGLKKFETIIWCAIKLAVMYLLFKLYSIFVSPSLPLDGINNAAMCTYLFLLVSHLAVQLIYTQKTIIGTKKFAFWQILCFVGILMARSYVLLGEMVAGTPLRMVLGYVTQQLPYFMAVHVPIQIVFLTVLYYMERRKQAQVFQ